MLLNPFRFGAPIPVEDWNPMAMAIRPAFWINDDSNIVEASGKAVKITSLTRTLTAENTTTLAPTATVAGLNGRRVLAFSGSQYLIPEYSSRNIPREIPAMWFFSVYNLSEGDTTPQERPILTFSQSGSNAYRAGITASNNSGVNTAGVGGRRIYTDSFAGTQASVGRTDQWVMILGVMDFAGRVISQYVNGALDDEVTGAWSSGGRVVGTFPDSMSIGASPSGAALMRGSIAEIIVGQGYIPDGDIDRLFGYAAHRWALADALPAAHPYKTDAPTYSPPTLLGFPALLAQNPVTYIGHRGNAYEYPEHTDVAYSESILSGELILEQDLYVTADGSAVCSHDATAAYTTTSGSAFSSLTDAQVSALTVDSTVWHSSLFTGAKIQLYSEVVTNHLAGAVFFTEFKTAAAIAPALSDVAASGVNPSKVLFSSFIASDLTDALAAGHPVMLQGDGSSDITVAAETAGAQYIGYVEYVNRAYMQRGIADGKEIIVYTTNRRSDARWPIRNGARALLTDDPKYLRATGPIATVSDYSNWMPGMIAGATTGTRPTREQRGRIFGTDSWGWDNATDYRAFCLQGWACPIKSDDFADDFTLAFDVTFDARETSTRWAMLMIVDGSELDKRYTNGTNYVNGYPILLRADGLIVMYREDLNGFTFLADSTAPSIAVGQKVRFEVIVTPTQITVRRMSGVTVISTVTATDSTYRGGYFHFGRRALACKFSNVVIT